MMPRSDSSDKYVLSQQEALRLLTEELGYESPSVAPTGMGNDYLTCLVRVANGEFKNVDWLEVKKRVRCDNIIEWKKEFEQKLKNEREN